MSHNYYGRWTLFMDQTQRIDPNQIPNVDPNRTQAMGAGAPVLDPNRTQIAPGIGAIPSRALELQLTLGRPVALAHSVARENLLVEVVGAQAMGTGRAPLNLCLVIDRSGSMEGPPLDYVKRACNFVVDMLTDQDVLSIVTFEEVVEVVMPPRKVVNKALIQEHINRLQPGNTTNLYDGLSLGLQQLKNVNLPGYLERLVLFTDGEPTVGIKDFSAIVNVAGQAKEHQISVTALGFGPDYNEELLAGIARRSGGKYYYVDRPELIPTVFKQEMERLLTVVARNLKMELQLSRWVQLRQVFGGELQMRSRTAEIGLVDVERGSRVTPLIEFEFPNHPPGTYRLAKLKLTYEDGITNRTETLTSDVVIEFTTDSARANVPQDPRVASETQVALTSRSLEKTLMGMRTHQLSPTMALQELQRTQQILIQQGRTMEAQELGQAIRGLQQHDSSGAVEKTLIGTVLNLEQGKKQN